MEEKLIKKLTIYIGTSLLIPTIFQFVYQKIVDEAKDFYGMMKQTLIISLGLFVLICLVELSLFIIRIKKERSCEEILKSIDDIANSIKLPNGQSMFDVKEQTYSLYDSIKQKESRLQRTFHDLHHTVYHSTSAKKHLNWIEFVFWSFLKRLHDELGCKIVIALHFDEKARETGLADHKERHRYEELFNCYSKIAKELIGNDVIIIDEKEFRGQRKQAKYYSQDFHDKFVKSMLQYVGQIIDGRIDYKGFMRKVSYIESVFPIMAYSRNNKMKFSRIYVLDRELAQEVWQQSPFIEFKTTHGIYFITAQTIRYENNEPMRIFSPEDTINITDSTAEIRRKLNTIDIPTKKTIIQLLTSAYSGKDDENVKHITDDNIDNSIIDIIGDINRKYNFNKRSGSSADQE